MKILSIVGARPQFIKASAISRAIRNYSGVQEVIVHTGQHYDPNMSDIFFKELSIPEPKVNLAVGFCSHGKQIARMLESLEEVLIAEQPDWILVYGDNNTTIAGALIASKLNIPVAHIEAGMRCITQRIPEEVNRVATDHMSDLLFAPTQHAMDSLAQEGLASKSFLSGDVMYDTLLNFSSVAQKKSKLGSIAEVKPGEYYLATVHRLENAESLRILQTIFLAFSELDYPVIVPLHPRTQKLIDDISFRSNVHIISPVGYLDMLTLLTNCHKVITDSGGLQKEAYLMQKPCITLREETEWIETLEGNWNFLVGTSKMKILEKIAETKFGEQIPFLGDGHAAEKIIECLLGKR